MTSLYFVFLCLLLSQSCCHAVTRQFSIEVAWAISSPDGHSRPQILVNGQSPGPTLVVDQGDEVEFHVCNKLNQSTSVHFHGIEQRNTPWSDGVPGLSQRPIPPDGEFLYKWTANEYGTYWYHAHHKSQLSDGFFGPIHIKPCRTQKRPFSKISSDPLALASLFRAEEKPQLVIISDWSHVTSAELIQIQEETNLDIYCTNSILFNGKGQVNCLTEEQQHQAWPPPLQSLFEGPLKGTWLTDNGCLPFTPFSERNDSLNLDVLPNIITSCQPTDTPLQDLEVDARDQWVSFNFISATTVQIPVLSIDGHPMWVYAIDGRYVEPQQVDGLQIYNGERYSVMVRLNNVPGTYMIRASNYGPNQLISGFATMTYSQGGQNWYNYGLDREFKRPSGWKQTESTPYFTYGGYPVSTNVALLNITLVTPLENIPPAREVDQTHILRIARSGAPWIWTLDGQGPYPVKPKAYAEDQPLLYYPNSTNAQNGDLVIRTKNNTWVDIIIISTETVSPAHAMHKHSNKAYVLGFDTGPWNWTTVAEAAAALPHAFNFDTPLLRDGYFTPAALGAPTWLVIRYHVVNPGAFMLHCHVQTHLTGGMAVALLDGIDVLPQIPTEYGAEGNGNGLP